jgi:nitric oxide dioxygenase
MTPHQINLIKSSWSQVKDHTAVGNLFYTRLFELAPETKSLFSVTVDTQSDKLGIMLGYIVNRLDKLDDIIDEVAKLARQHAAYGVRPEHYELGGGIFLWCLEKLFAERWNEELRQAWTDCYGTLTNAMIDAAEYSKLDAA